MVDGPGGNGFARTGSVASASRKGPAFFADAVIYTTHELFDKALEAAEAGIAFARSNGFLGNAAYMTRYASDGRVWLGTA